MQSSPPPRSPPDDSYPDPKSASSITSLTSTLESGGPITPRDEEHLHLEEEQPTSESQRGRIVTSGRDRKGSMALDAYKPSKLQPIPPFVPKTAPMPSSTQLEAAPTAIRRGSLAGGFPSVFEIPGGVRQSERPSTSNGAATRGLGIELEKDASERRSPATEESAAGSAGRKRRLVEENDDHLTIKRESSPFSHPPPSIPNRLSPSVSPRPHSSHASLPVTTLNATQKRARVSPSHDINHAASSLLSIRNPPPPISPIVLGFSPNNKTEFEQVERTLSMKQQQQREIERRNNPEGSGTPSSSRLGGGLNGALKKLDEREKEKERERIAMEAEEHGASSSLAKRRKTKNLTVLTPGYGHSSSAGGLKSAPAKAQSQSQQQLARLPNGTAIPSVLIGSSNATATAAATSARTHRIPNGPATSVPTTQIHRTTSSGSGQVRREPPQTARVVSGSNYPSVVQQPSAASSSRGSVRPNGTGPSTGYPQSASVYSTVHPQARDPEGSSSTARRGAQYPPGHPLHRPNQSGGAAYYSPPSTNAVPVSPPSTSSLQLPSSSNSPSHSNSKAAFLSLFSTFYDSLSDSRVLTSNLEEQIKKSSYLLNTLQDSSKIFEEMLDSRIENCEKVLSRDLLLNERRIQRLEKLVVGSQGSERLGERREGERSLEERLERIERMLEERRSEPAHPSVVAE